MYYDHKYHILFITHIISTNKGIFLTSLHECFWWSKPYHCVKQCCDLKSCIRRVICDGCMTPFTSEVTWYNKKVIIPSSHRNQCQWQNAELQIRCIKLTLNGSTNIISAPNPMFDHLLESSQWDDSNKWSNIILVKKQAL